MSERAAVVLASLGLALFACGRTVPHGGEPARPEPGAEPTPAARPARLQATDLIPADLDLVVRVDLAKARSSLGPEPTQELSRHAIDQADPDSIVREALERADVAWLGLRADDLLAGDRVLVVESAHPQPTPDPLSWTAAPSTIAGTRIFDAAAPPRRSETARILLVRDRAAVFVTPVEVDSVERVLARGPDPQRCEPAARGLLSLDWRVRPPSVELQNRFPSLAALMRGIVRMRAVATTDGNQLELEGRMQCRDERAAGRVLTFLRTIGETAQQLERYRDLLASLELSRQAATVRVRWTIAPGQLLGLTRTATAPPP